MSPWVWLAAWVVCVAWSIIFHELAHTATALRLGWRYNGLTFKWYVLGIGVKLEPVQEKHGRQLALTAAMGPIASLVAGLVFLALANAAQDPYAQTVFASMYALNVVIAFVNLVPTPITDGGHILMGLFGWRMRWRYLIFAWIAAELVALWILFL